MKNQTFFCDQAIDLIEAHPKWSITEKVMFAQFSALLDKVSNSLGFADNKEMNVDDTCIGFCLSKNYRYENDNSMKMDFVRVLSLTIFFGEAGNELVVEHATNQKKITESVVIKLDHKEATTVKKLRQIIKAAFQLKPGLVYVESNRDDT